MTVERAAWRALGTNIELLVNDGRLGPAREAVAALIDRVDVTYSRFRADSELSRLQATEGDEATVSWLLGLAIDTALRAARATGGLVDPTIGRVLRVTGYDRDFDLIRDHENQPVLTVDAVPGWTTVDWQPASRRLRIPRGVELDLGATGKALAVDLAAETVLAGQPVGAGALVAIGGDLRAAGKPPAGGWRVRLADDSTVAADVVGDLAVIEEGGMATSSTLVRRWRAGGTMLHHLIDPRTALPARGPWRTVTVVAVNCVEANTMATAAIILGADAVGWLEAVNAPARLVAVDGTATWLGPWARDGIEAAVAAA